MFNKLHFIKIINKFNYHFNTQDGPIGKATNMQARGPNFGFMVPKSMIRNICHAWGMETFGSPYFTGHSIQPAHKHCVQGEILSQKTRRAKLWKIPMSASGLHTKTDKCMHVHVYPHQRKSLQMNRRVKTRKIRTIYDDMHCSKWSQFT